MRVTALTSETASHWYESIHAVPGDTERLNDALSGGPLSPQLRLVAIGETGVCGRFGAQRRDTGISFWTPLFRADVSPAARRQAMRLFLEALILHRDAAGLGHFPLETEPGDDQPDNPAWLDALGQAGFAETCTYRLYVLPAASFAGAAASRPGIALDPLDPAGLLHLADLFEHAYDDTRERRRRSLEAPHRYVGELRAIGEGFEPGLWLMARMDGAPAAFALANRARDLSFPGMSAWLLEIGCLPEFRQRGLARALLSALTLRLKDTDCERLLSTIDDANAASIRLHRSQGFAVQPEQFYVYRRTA